MSVSANVPVITKDMSTEVCSASQEAASVSDAPVLVEAVAQSLDTVASENEVVTVATPKEQAPLALTEEDKKVILKQVGFYFSDINLPNDKFMRDKISQDSEGFVDLALILTFKKMHPYKGVPEQVAETLRSAEELVVSEDGLKLRRLTPPSFGPTKYHKQNKSTLAFKGVPEENRESFLDRFFEFLRAILIEAFASSGASIPRYFARTQTNIFFKDPQNLKTYTLIELSNPEFAVALYNYFQSIPCVFDSVPLQVFTRYELMIKSPSYVTPFPSEQILKIVGVSETVSKDDIKLLKERIGNVIWHIGFPKKKPDCLSNYAYLGVRQHVPLPPLIEKLTGIPISSQKTSAESSSNDTKVTAHSSCPEAADEDKTNAGSGEQEGQSTATEATDAVSMQEIQVESTVSEVSMPTESVEAVSKQEIQTVSNEATISKDLPLARVFSVETPTEDEITEARFIFKFCPSLPFEEPAKRKSKDSNGKSCNNSLPKRVRGLKHFANRKIRRTE